MLRGAMTMTTYGPANRSTTTTDATPTEGIFDLGLPEDAVGEVDYLIVARRDATGDAKVWNLNIAVKRDGTGNVATIGSGLANLLASRDTGLGTLGWAATVGVSGTSVTCTITGAASQTISWGVQMLARYESP